MDRDRRSLTSIKLNQSHDLQSFKCERSSRIEKFLRLECHDLIRQNYCNIFVIPDPENESRILGYYSLCAYVINRNALGNMDERRAPLNYSVPLALIGFIGRSDDADKGFGRMLIVDAARRAKFNEDIAVWGLALESDGGPGNSKLWEWYKIQGFKAAKSTDENSRLMYASFNKLGV